MLVVLVRGGTVFEYVLEELRQHTRPRRVPAGVQDGAHRTVSGLRARAPGSGWAKGEGRQQQSDVVRSPSRVRVNGAYYIKYGGYQASTVDVRVVQVPLKGAVFMLELGTQHVVEALVVLLLEEDLEQQEPHTEACTCSSPPIRW